MKTIKTAISMPDDLYQAVKDHAGDRPFSTTMCDLIRAALGLEVIPVSSGITENSIYEQLRELTARIEAIEGRVVIPAQEQAPEPGTAPVSITEVLPEVIPETEPVIPAVIPESIPATHQGDPEPGEVQALQEKVKELVQKYGSFRSLAGLIGRNPSDKVFTRLMKENRSSLNPAEVKKIMEEL